jgi:hypothetical protein
LGQMAQKEEGFTPTIGPLSFPAGALVRPACRTLSYRAADRPTYPLGSPRTGRLFVEMLLPFIGPATARGLEGYGWVPARRQRLAAISSGLLLYSGRSKRLNALPRELIEHFGTSYGHQCSNLPSTARPKSHSTSHPTIIQPISRTVGAG